LKTVAKRHEFLKISKNNHRPKGQELSNQRNSMKKLTGGSECKIQNNEEPNFLTLF